jgi:hypothetical protein
MTSVALRCHFSAPLQQYGKNGLRDVEMSAPNRAQQFDAEREGDRASETSPGVAPPPGNRSAPALRFPPFPRKPHPRRFAAVPTHAVGVHPEQREYPRATLKLPLKLRSVNGIAGESSVSLVTRDISSTGVFFLCPQELPAGSSIELEVVLVSRPMGRGNVVLVTDALVCRSEPAATPGWFGVAATFADVAFGRDDNVPSRFLPR